MKRVLVSMIVFFLTQETFSQAPMKEMPMSQQNPAVGYGKIKGEVVDKANGNPVPFATIALIDLKTQKTVNGAVADEDGKFNIKSLNSGRYKGVISFIGYSDLIIESIEISEKGNTENLGKLAIEETTKQLDEVVVTGEKDLIEEKIDRLVYNAEKDATTVGGDAVDVLRRVPLLSVDLNGNVSLRGSQNIKVLIDNRPSTISASGIADALKQIPADQIKSVEVITSPSARYDAEGTGGIINIITKKNNLQGASLDINSGIGTRGSNLGLNGNYRKGRHGLSIGGFGRSGYNIKGEYTNEQLLTDTENDASTLIRQHATTDNTMLFGRYNLGWDYEINKYNWISTTVNYGIFNSDGNQNNLLTQEFQNNTLTNESRQNVNSTNHSNTLDVTLNFVKTFDKKGKELSILTQYSQNTRSNDFENNFLDAGNQSITSRFKNINDSYNKEITLQIDYTSPIGENKIIEFGGKNIVRQVTSDYQSFTSTGEDDPYQPASSGQLTNIFDYTQNISAAYLSYTQNLAKDYSIKAGARYEYTTIAANFSDNEEVDIPSYGAVVPSINLSKKLKKGNTIKLAYTRRIQRPSLQFLNPNVQANNPKNITQGNPELNPEYTNNIELSYSTFKMGKSINFSLFARNTNESIQPVRSAQGDDIVYTTYSNIGKEEAYGLSVFTNIMAGEKFMLSGGVDTYYAILDNNASDPAFKASNSGLVISGRLFGSYNFTEKWSLQAFGFARGTSIQLQGSQSGFYMYSLNFNRNFKDKKGSIGIGAENFLTPQTNITVKTDSPGLSQTNVNGMRNMNFKINLRYRFGKISANSMRKKKGKSIKNEDLKEGQNTGEQMMSQ